MRDAPALFPQVPRTPAKAFQFAVAFHQQGRLQEAERFYRTVLKADRNHVDSLHNLGRICLHLGRVEEAAKLIRRAIQKNPNSAQINCDLGVALCAAGRHQEAVPRFEKAIALNPNLADAESNLATALQSLGQTEEAVAHFRKAIEINPALAEAHNNLGNALRLLNRNEEALTHFEKALELRPDFAEAHNNLGLVLLPVGRNFEAIEHLEKSIALKPNFAEAHNNLGFALLTVDWHSEAVEHFEKAVALKADFAEAYNNLGYANMALKRVEDAVACYRKALAIKPDWIAAHDHLVTALQSLGRTDEVIDACKKMLTIHPINEDVHIFLGVALQEMGRMSEARITFEKVVELNPRNASAYRGISESRKFVAEDPYLAAMESLAVNISSLSREQQIEIHFALGKVYEDINQHERSFHHLLNGNALKRQEVNYDEAKTLSLFERTREVFTAEFIRRRQGVGDPRPLPIFIVGMPRSGTTLVEQILASHPKIFGAGELTDLGRAVEALEGPDAAAPFPEFIASMSDEQLREFGGHYVDGIRAFAPEAARITDKMPSNFLFAGLIHLALPNARIIHTRRNPVDTCLSCFSKLFVFGNAHTFDLAELGRYYRGYAHLMDHWHNVLPSGAMLEVDYEEVVADLEGQARRIVAYCGLPWNDACLSFYETERAVRTASATQVRQPIYRSAVGRWKPYQDLLRPLLDELGDKLTGAPQPGR